MDYVTWWLLVVSASACACSGERWEWPDAAAAPSLRIDTKVRFIDGDATHRHDKSAKDRVQEDEVPFEESSDTEEFYNRPPGSGGHPVRVQAHGSPYRQHQHALHPSQNELRNNDGTLDSLRYCKCVSTPDCVPRHDSLTACGAGKYLCCYKKPNHGGGHNSEVFSEIEDERPMLLPGRESIARPFPPPPGTELNGLFGPGHGHEAALLGAMDRRPQRPSPALLSGPQGPTGIIGPAHQKPVLVGPDGPTGVIGPLPNSNRPGVLVGPDGPKDVKSSETAQRGVLVGPGGPTGIVGPAGYGRRRVLVGPGGPTGIIGPGRQRGLILGQGGPAGFYGNNRQQGLLVGPDGPTGNIGPNRQVLVGPGGPTGQIGPYGYNHYGK